MISDMELLLLLLERVRKLDGMHFRDEFILEGS